MKYVLYLVVSSLILVGCQNNEAESPQQGNNAIQVKDPGERPNEELSGQEVANRLAEIASRVPNVNDSTAVVAGPYAVVGIDVDADLDRSRVGSIKYSVAESLRHDPYGRNAAVVADPDTFNRLQEMGNQMGQGQPGTAIMNELAAIVGRVMPQVPNDITTPEQPTEQNEDPLPQGEQQELDQIQEEQSKHKLNQ